VNSELPNAMPSHAATSTRGTAAADTHISFGWACEVAEWSHEGQTLSVAALQHELATQAKTQCLHSPTQLEQAMLEARTEARDALAIVGAGRQREVR